MSQNYSNLPTNSSNSESTIQAFSSYYTAPIEINSSVYAAMTGFFTNRGFDEAAAESISTIIISQSKRDGFNPMKILDTLKGLNSIELSGLLGEILNYNRFKTSSLGIAQPPRPNAEIQRNILA
jgi:hypothetical protein